MNNLKDNVDILKLYIKFSKVAYSTKGKSPEVYNTFLQYKQLLRKRLVSIMHVKGTSTNRIQFAADMLFMVNTHPT